MPVAFAGYRCERGTATGPNSSSSTVVCWDEAEINPFAEPVVSTGSADTVSEDGAASTNVVALPTVKVLASKIKCEILSQDYNNKEYIGFVYGTPGGPMASGIISGTPLSAKVGIALQQLGLDPIQVLSMVHNHDINTYGAGDPAVAVENQVPSSSDWAAYKTLLNLGENRQFGQFIVGPDTTMRYFDGSNMNTPPSRNLPAGSVSGGACQ